MFWGGDSRVGCRQCHFGGREHVYIDRRFSLSLEYLPLFSSSLSFSFPISYTYSLFLLSSRPPVFPPSLYITHTQNKLQIPNSNKTFHPQPVLHPPCNPSSAYQLNYHATPRLSSLGSGSKCLRDRRSGNRRGGGRGGDSSSLSDLNTLVELSPLREERRWEGKVKVS